MILAFGALSVFLFYLIYPDVYMKVQNESNPHKSKVMRLLGLTDEHDHDSILSHYNKVLGSYQEQMRKSANIRERIRLQNLMIALDDAFLDYQSSLCN